MDGIEGLFIGLLHLNECFSVLYAFYLAYASDDDIM